ncbi:MAG TPA: fumarylacetoacetate hydrolase family protein [Halanaerobiales bacterium]|nr:fumarylacetoacetate hydrolase family protein [Halanaerobiales bacterium]
MKIARYLYENEINYGVVKKDKIKKISGNIFSNFQIDNSFINKEEVEFLSPVIPPNIIAIGLNYKKHAEESGSKLPEKPLIFLKATTSLAGNNDLIKLPKMAPNEVDFEAEMAVIIGEKAKDIEPDQALDYVLGFSCANDVSARDCQKKIDKQWARGKSFDTFCPLGPVIETELNPQNLKIQSILNGEIMQSSNTADMIFSVKEIVSYLSKNMTLLPGTVILTGTPEGVGFAREEPVFLKEGDEIEIKIENIGNLKNEVVKE